MFASEEDRAFYDKCVEGLPTINGLNGTGMDADGVPLPCGLGPHSVRCLRRIVEVVKPDTIFEIGFNMGWSSALWLELSDASVLSCDISYKAETVEAARILTERYPGRFRYVNRTEREAFEQAIRTEKWDLAFIDGGHLFQDVMGDLILCVFDRGIKNIAMDDWLPEYGQVQEAVEKISPPMRVVEILGNIALLRWGEE